MSDSLIKTLDRAIKFDTWGQRVEAADEYERFISLHVEASRKLKLAGDSKDEIEDILERVQQRQNFLQSSVEVVEPVSLTELSEDLDCLKKALSKVDLKLQRRRSSIIVESEDRFLLPPIEHKLSGKTYIAVKLIKIGLKDAKVYVDPFITVSVRNSEGSTVDPIQNTNPSYFVQQNHIFFNVECHLQTPLQDLPDDATIFLEFKHYKEKKDKMSVRCYAILERDEFKPGELCLELYEKPVNYLKRNVELLTEKSLFFTVELKFEKIE